MFEDNFIKIINKQYPVKSSDFYYYRTNTHIIYTNREIDYIIPKKNNS